MAKKFNDGKNLQNPVGPGAYTIKDNHTAPIFSFGSRFDSDIRSKDHLKPRKKLEPGPGSYEM